MRVAVACLIASVALVAALVLFTSGGPRPGIDRVVVDETVGGRLRFRVLFAAPISLYPSETLQVLIDSDRDGGFEYGLDWSGSDRVRAQYEREFSGSPSLLTSVKGWYVKSHPPSLRFSYDGTRIRRRVDVGGFLGFPLSQRQRGLHVSSAAFSIAASALGDPHRFDFIARLDDEEGEDLAPSHVLVSASSQPWTYTVDEPKTYTDLTDFTLEERGSGFVTIVGGSILALGFGVGAVVAAGRAFQTRRARRHPAAPAHTDA
jgi:hypothetical protein